MITLNCLLFDKDPSAIKVIENLLLPYHEIKIIGKFLNSLEALEFIQYNPLDLIFFDIDKQSLNGNKIIEYFKKETLVIFTTSHSKFVSKTIEKRALDYLIKPISLLRFIKTMCIVFDHIQSLQNQQQLKPDKHFYFKSDKKWIKIQLDSILYIECIKDYLKLVTVDKTIILHKTLTSVTANLPKEKFIRVHRSFCISIDKIDAFEGNIIFIRNFKIPISRSFIHEFKKRIINPHII